MHTGREGTEDGLQKGIPQMLTEAILCGTLETGQRQQQYVSVIFLISTLGTRSGRKMNSTDGAKTHHSAMGTSAHSDDLVLINASSVSASK